MKLTNNFHKKLKWGKNFRKSMKKYAHKKCNVDILQLIGDPIRPGHSPGSFSGVPGCSMKSFFINEANAAKLKAFL